MCLESTQHAKIHDTYKKHIIHIDLWMRHGADLTSCVPNKNFVKVADEFLHQIDIHSESTKPVTSNVLHSLTVEEVIDMWTLFIRCQMCDLVKDHFLANLPPSVMNFATLNNMLHFFYSTGSPCIQDAQDYCKDVGISETDLIRYSPVLDECIIWGDLKTRARFTAWFSEKKPDIYTFAPLREKVIWHQCQKVNDLTPFDIRKEVLFHS